MSETIIRPLTPDEMEEIRRAARDEERVLGGFLRSARRVAASLPFAEDLTAAWHCASDRDTPTRVRVTLIAALAYFIAPLDALPDLTPILGFSDDAAVLGAAIAAVAGSITAEHRRRARETLSWLRDMG